MTEWGTAARVDPELSWSNVPPLPRPNITQEVPPWGSPDRPSAPSENNLSPKKPPQNNSWGHTGKSENSFMSRNDDVQVGRFSDKSFPERGPTKLSDDVPPVNMGIDKINDQREDDEEYACLAYQAATQQSFESLKENKERFSSEILEDDNWDPDYHNIPVSDSPQLAKGRAESSITASPIPTSSRKEFVSVHVQTDQIDLAQIVVSNQKLLSFMIDSEIMRIYQQKKYQPQQQSLLDLSPEELDNTFNKHTNVENVEDPWNISSGKRDDIIPPNISETNAREPDNNYRRPIQTPPNNENLLRNNNLDSGPQPEQANGWGAPTGKSDRSNVSQQTPTQDNAYSQPVRDNQNDKNDRSQGPSDVSNDNINKDSWDANAGASDWMKQRDMFTKELEVKSNSTSWEQSKDQRTEDSYGGSFNDRSSSNNRYGSRDGNRDGNRYGNRKTCNICGSEDHLARNCPDESSRGGYGGHSGGGACHKCGEEGHFARDCTNESSRGGYGGYSGRATNESNRDGRTCHKCGKEGHIARECPNDVCYKCNKPGHHANDCNEDAYETTGQDGSFGEGSREYRTKSSPFSDPRPSDISSEDAWAKLIEADKKGEIDDFKEALELYAKVTPVVTFQSIEEKLRGSHCKTRIMAIRREEIPLKQVLMDLQGNTNKRYVAMPVMDPSRLSRTVGDLAQDERENFEWLADAGFMVDDPGPVCHNCKQKGHNTRDCKEPKREIEKQTTYMTCQHCNSPNHLTKHCDQKRNDFYTDARDRRHNRDPVNDDKASSINDGEEDRRGFRGYGSSNSQTCHNCHREGHISRDCPEKRSGIKCYKCNEEGHLSKDCNKENYNDYNKSTSYDTYGDNSRSKTGGDSTSQDISWNKSGGDDSTISRDQDNREVKNDVDRDSSLSTQDKTLQQKDISPSNTGKPVEPDSWEAPTNASTAQNVDWGNKTHTLEDFNWTSSNNNNNAVSDKHNKGPEDNYESKREDPYNKGSDYENRPSRGNDQSYNKGSDDYDSRRGRGNNNSYNNDDWRSRGNNNNSYNNDDYDSRRGRGSYNNNSDDYDRRGRGNNNNSYNNNYSDDYERRGRGGYNNSDDSRRGRGSYNNNSDDYDRRSRGNNSYNRSGDDFGRSRGGNSYNKSDDYGRGRGNDSYNRSSDDYGRGRNESYNRSDDYGRSRGNDSYNRSSDDYGRGRNESYNRSDDYGRSRGNDSYSRGSDDYGRGRGSNTYNDYGRSRGNDSYNKSPGDYGRNRGNDYSYNNRGSDSYDRRDRDWTKSNKTQEPRDTQSNANPSGTNLDTEPWW